MKFCELLEDELEPFFDYLEGQIRDNGVGDTPYFMPFSSSINVLDERVKRSFSSGICVSLNHRQWRKCWVVKNDCGSIVGHIDLRHYAEEHHSHRVLLGMGVDKVMRGRGLGFELISIARDFCCKNNQIEWLDLNVLGGNLPAISFYNKSGFKQIGMIDDFYRIDGRPIAELTMTMSTHKK